MTDAEKRDAAVAELKLTTQGYLKSNGQPRALVGAQWKKGLDLLAQIGAAPPPSTTTPRYLLPQLATPTVIDVTRQNYRSLGLQSGRDYVLRVREILPDLLMILGGRNVNVIGHEADVKGSGASSYWDHGALALRDGDPGSTIYCTGFRLAGATLNDGIALATNRHLILQTGRIGPTSAFAVYHPDGIQAQGDVLSLKMDLVTIESQLQCTFFGDHDTLSKTPLGPITMSRVDLIGKPGKMLFWKSATWPSAPPVTIEDCTMWMDSPWTPDPGYWVYPNRDGESSSMFDTAPWIDSKIDPARKARVTTLAGGTKFVDWIGTNISGGFAVKKRDGVAGIPLGIGFSP